MVASRRAPRIRAARSDRADELQAHADALWAAACNRRLRELAGEPQNPEEAGFRAAAELDGVRRMIRDDLCDRILSEEWERRV